MLHIAYGRDYLRPTESYDDRGDEYVRCRREAFGDTRTNGFYGTTPAARRRRHAVAMQKFEETCAWQMPDHPLFS